MPLILSALWALFTALGLFDTDGDAGGSGESGDGGGDSGKVDGSKTDGGKTDAGKTDDDATDGKKDGETDSAQKGTRESDVAKLQRELNEARSQAGQYRTTATKTLVALAEELGIELTTTEKGKVDPDQAVKQLTDQLTELKAENRQNAIDAAFERVVVEVGAKPGLTRRYIQAVDGFKDLDPKAADFRESLKGIVQAAIDDEPDLKAAPSQVGGSFDGGARPPAGKPAASLDEAVAGHYATGRPS